MEYLVVAAYAALAFFSLLFSYLVWSRFAKKPRNLPAEAAGARFLVGHLDVVSGRVGLPHVNLANLADENGPIFRIRLGVHPAVVVSSWELAKELFTTHDATVSSRPQIKAGKHLAYDHAMLGFSSYGPYWRQLRKLISLELLSARRVELQRSARASETALLLRDLHARCGSGRALVDMKELFGELSMNVVLGVVAGKRFSGRDEAEEARRCRRVMRDFFHLAGFFVPADALPYLGWLDLGGHERRMKTTAKELDDIVGEWLVEHRQKGNSGKDFMDVMISVMEGADLQSHYDVDTIIKATCGNLISGGTDATAVVLIWALSVLLNNRHVIKKAQEEIDKHVGKERLVSESDITNLVYLQAICKESLRLYPPAPLGGTRRLTQDCKIGGYDIPQGTWLMVNMWKMHRDPRVWPDPLEFRPERFLEGDKIVDVKGQDFKMIPFGAGRRICPGANFGQQMVQIVLATLLQSFDLSTPDDQPIDMTESAGLTNFKATPLDVLITPRLPPTLYT
ncbi:cytochrome P450 CYP82D47-like [Salvia hispanica]|uniref:cytochrome P450 CYP82D47-like n=1 Tax=Salvia hispanica TaxID=49212 RepID=UPI0020092730|nr:cytochrome P450 CYP82D47-like [Salvia hispanica]